LALFSETDQACPHWHPSRLNSIHHPTQLPCAPHKLVRTPDTQPRQHHTHYSVCKVVLPARAFARCCAPTSPILLPVRLRGWREQRDRNSMVTIQNSRLWLALFLETDQACPHWHPSRISATRSPFTTLLSCHVLHTSLRERQTPSPDSITLTPASARSCCLPGPLQDAAHRHRRCCSSQGCGVSTNLHESNELGSFLQIARTVLQTVAEGTKRNYLSKSSYSSFLSVGSLRLRSLMASSSFTMLANHAPITCTPSCTSYLIAFLHLLRTCLHNKVPKCAPTLRFPRIMICILLSPQ
jgi:hypothetical protein